ncbi:MAG: hypothetical protein ACRDTZ_00385 [Pseudonocardiaceae bacterium]
MKSPRTILVSLAAGAAAVLAMTLSMPLATAAQPTTGSAQTCAEAQDDLDAARALDPIEDDGSDGLESDGSDKLDGESDAPETNGSDSTEQGDLPPFDESDELDGPDDAPETDGTDEPETDGSDAPEPGEVTAEARQNAIGTAASAVDKACTGPAGENGEPGKPGEPGKDGADGADGKAVPCNNTCTPRNPGGVVIVSPGQPTTGNQGVGGGSRDVGEAPAPTVTESDLVVTH